MSDKYDRIARQVDEMIRAGGRWEDLATILREEIPETGYGNTLTHIPAPQPGPKIDQLEAQLAADRERAEIAEHSDMIAHKALKIAINRAEAAELTVTALRGANVSLMDRAEKAEAELASYKAAMSLAEETNAILIIRCEKAEAEAKALRGALGDMTNYAYQFAQNEHIALDHPSDKAYLDSMDADIAKARSLLAGKGEG